MRPAPIGRCTLSRLWIPRASCQTARPSCPSLRDRRQAVITRAFFRRGATVPTDTPPPQDEGWAFETGSEAVGSTVLPTSAEA
jgi:hypothetical protein